MLSTLSDTLYTFGIFGLVIVVFSFIGGFLNREKDWRVVWTIRGDWKTHHTGGPEGTYTTQEKCWYEIKYSPSRKKYKLVLGGESPKEHSAYKLAIDKLNEFYGIKVN